MEQKELSKAMNDLLFVSAICNTVGAILGGNDDAKAQMLDKLGSNGLDAESINNLLWCADQMAACVRDALQREELRRVKLSAVAG